MNSTFTYILIAGCITGILLLYWQQRNMTITIDHLTRQLQHMHETLAISGPSMPISTSENSDSNLDKLLSEYRSQLETLGEDDEEELEDDDIPDVDEDDDVEEEDDDVEEEDDDEDITSNIHTTSVVEPEVDSSTTSNHNVDNVEHDDEDDEDDEDDDEETSEDTPAMVLEKPTISRELVEDTIVSEESKSQPQSDTDQDTTVEQTQQQPKDPYADVTSFFSKHMSTATTKKQPVITTSSVTEQETLQTLTKEDKELLDSIEPLMDISNNEHKNDDDLMSTDTTHSYSQYNSVTSRQLKELCNHHKLALTGSKPVLVTRLLKFAKYNNEDEIINAALALSK